MIENTVSENRSGNNIVTPRKKLIEVALPLEAINAAIAREEPIQHSRP